MRKPAVAEATMLDAVIGASAGWFGGAGEQRAHGKKHEMTRQVPKILAAAESNIVPR
jgi:hypothetical protein